MKKLSIPTILLLLVLLVASTLNGHAAIQNQQETVQAVETSFGWLQKLFVQENMLVTENGYPVFLIGCNVRGNANNPAEDGQYDDWYTDRHIDANRLASYKFNCIRLLCHWEEIETSKSPKEFVYDMAYVEKIRKTVEAYNSEGIYVIIDLHEHSDVNVLGKFLPTRGNDGDFADAFFSDKSSTSGREHLKRLWLMLSETFKNYPGVAGYDILNEPHHSGGSLSDQQVANYWFDIADYVIAALRDAGDNHIAFVGFSPNARQASFMSRKLIDTNVVYEIHFYQGIDESKLLAAENDYNWLQGRFNKDVNNIMRKFNIPFIMGEQGFGGDYIKSGDPQDIWLKNVLDIQKTSPLMQGWLYFCYISYNGKISGGGWHTTLTQQLSDRLTPSPPPRTANLQFVNTVNDILKVQGYMAAYNSSTIPVTDSNEATGYVDQTTYDTIQAHQSVKPPPPPSKVTLLFFNAINEKLTVQGYLTPYEGYIIPVIIIYNVSAYVDEATYDTIQAHLSVKPPPPATVTLNFVNAISEKLTVQGYVIEYDNSTFPVTDSYNVSAYVDEATYDTIQAHLSITPPSPFTEYLLLIPIGAAIAILLILTRKKIKARLSTAKPRANEWLFYLRSI